jgi:hypothetical protein
MDNATLAIFIHEIRNQCLYTQASFSVFSQSFEQKIHAGVFFSAQSTLLAASQLSNLIWPTGPRSKKRGEEVRRVLELDEKHPLNNHRIRTVWDKSDEKLEKWASETKGGNVVFDHLGDMSQFDPSSFTQENIYRLYDPTTAIFIFRGDSYNMQALGKAIADINGRTLQVHQILFPNHYKEPEVREPDESSNDKVAKKPKSETKAKKKTKKKATAKSAKSAKKKKA